MSDGNGKGTVVLNRGFKRRTEYDEQVVSEPIPEFALSPQSSPNKIRDDYSSSGTGANVSNGSDGLILLESGTDGSGTAEIETKERGRYQSSKEGTYSLGVGLSNLPQGNQEVLWGAFDSQTGLGFRIDRDGVGDLRLSRFIKNAIGKDDIVVVFVNERNASSPTVTVDLAAKEGIGS